jgi:hypothetical protein
METFLNLLFAFTLQECKLGCLCEVTFSFFSKIAKLR